MGKIYLLIHLFARTKAIEIILYRCRVKLWFSGEKEKGKYCFFFISIDQISLVCLSVCRSRARSREYVSVDVVQIAAFLV